MAQPSRFGRTFLQLFGLSNEAGEAARIDAAPDSQETQGSSETDSLLQKASQSCPKTESNNQSGDKGSEAADNDEPSHAASSPPCASPDIETGSAGVKYPGGRRSPYSLIFGLTALSHTHRALDATGASRAAVWIVLLTLTLVSALATSGIMAITLLYDKSCKETKAACEAPKPRPSLWWLPTCSALQDSALRPVGLVVTMFSLALALLTALLALSLPAAIVSARFPGLLPSETLLRPFNLDPMLVCILILVNGVCFTLVCIISFLRAQSGEDRQQKRRECLIAVRAGLYAAVKPAYLFAVVAAYLMCVTFVIVVLLGVLHVSCAAAAWLMRTAFQRRVRMLWFWRAAMWMWPVADACWAFYILEGAVWVGHALVMMAIWLSGMSGENLPDLYALWHDKSGWHSLFWW